MVWWFSKVCNDMPIARIRHWIKRQMSTSLRCLQSNDAMTKPQLPLFQRGLGSPVVLRRTSNIRPFHPRVPLLMV